MSGGMGRPGEGLGIGARMRTATASVSTIPPAAVTPSAGRSARQGVRLGEAGGLGPEQLPRRVEAAGDADGDGPTGG